MGGANEICTDKTGTLTQNMMTVQAIYHQGKVVEGDANAALKESESGDVTISSVISNMTAFVEKVEGEIIT